MSNTFIRVTMPDSSKWDVDAEVIAHDRARHFANQDVKDPSTDGSLAQWNRVYDDEFAYTMSDDGELLDWAANNMNWSDVQRHAVKVQEPPQAPPDYQEGWVNGDREIVRK